METLNTAAHAAGFAMAASEEPYEKVEAEAKVPAPGWQPSEPALLTSAALVERPHGMGDWFRSMLGLFGRRAPA
jgi:hypothetical protein